MSGTMRLARAAACDLRIHAHGCMTPSGDAEALQKQLHIGAFDCQPLLDVTPTASCPASRNMTKLSTTSISNMAHMQTFSCLMRMGPGHALLQHTKAQMKWTACHDVFHC